MSEAIKHNNVAVFDDRGIPSMMVRFENPRAAVTPEMFIIGGKEVDAIYISKYPNKVIKGRAYSLPMVDPTTEITFDEALAACRTKGEGWHLMTATEGEYLPLRGSSFINTSNSGPSTLGLNNPRSNSQGSVGFRSAFYEVNGKLITE